MEIRHLIRTLERVQFEGTSREDLQSIVDRCVEAFYRETLKFDVGSRVCIVDYPCLPYGVIVEIRWPKLDMESRVFDAGSVYVDWKDLEPCRSYTFEFALSCFEPYSPPSSL